MKNRVKQFTECTGTNPLNIDYIDLQYVLDRVKKIASDKLLGEEVQELRDATDVKNILDAIIDIGVYYNQLVLLMEHIGIDYINASNAVCDNNDLKYTTSLPLVMQWYSNHKLNNSDADVHIEDNEVDGVKYFCLKNSGGKVVKYLGFPTVDLTEYIPEEWL